MVVWEFLRPYRIARQTVSYNSTCHSHTEVHVCEGEKRYMVHAVRPLETRKFACPAFKACIVHTP